MKITEEAGYKLLFVPKFLRFTSPTIIFTFIYTAHVSLPKQV